MAVDNLDLDVKFWDSGPGWQVYPTKPLILDLYMQKHSQKLWPFELAHSRFFRLH